MLVPGAAGHVYIIGWDEAIVAVKADENPVWVRCVENLEHRIFGEGELLVCLSRVFVQGTSAVDCLCLGPQPSDTTARLKMDFRTGRKITHLLDISARDQAVGLLLILCAGLLLDLPPVILGALFEEV